MDKNTFGAIIATSLLDESFMGNVKGGWKNFKTELHSEKPANTVGTKVAGAIGTGLGKVYSVARKGAVPFVATGLEKTGEKIANTGRNAAEGLAKSTIGLGRKMYYKGQDLRNKYKK